MSPTESKLRSQNWTDLNHGRQEPAGLDSTESQCRGGSVIGRRKERLPILWECHTAADERQCSQLVSPETGREWQMVAPEGMIKRLESCVKRTCWEWEKEHRDRRQHRMARHCIRTGEQGQRAGHLVQESTGGRAVERAKWEQREIGVWSLSVIY